MPATSTPTTAAQRAIDAVWRIESPRLIAGLTRMVRDVGLAEELAQDALVAALETWPADGVPDNPGAWLMATARRRAIDRLRRDTLAEHKHGELGTELALERELAMPDLDAALDDTVGDDLPRLVFIACHPVLSTEARVALTLRLLGGFTTEEIARAFLVPEPTIAQRIVRAKRTLADAHVPFEGPRGDELKARLSSVLEVVYLVFNEGYSATRGADWMRPALCEDALRLGRVVAGLVPDEPEAHGLIAHADYISCPTKAHFVRSIEPYDRGPGLRLVFRPFGEPQSPPGTVLTGFGGLSAKSPSGPGLTGMSEFPGPLSTERFRRTEEGRNTSQKPVGEGA